jgi:hypothetical protein
VALGSLRVQSSCLVIGQSVRNIISAFCGTFCIPGHSRKIVQTAYLVPGTRWRQGIPVTHPACLHSRALRCTCCLRPEEHSRMQVRIACASAAAFSLAWWIVGMFWVYDLHPHSNCATDLAKASPGYSEFALTGLRMLFRVSCYISAQGC